MTQAKYRRDKELAREIAAFLDSIGQRKMAEDVRSMWRSRARQGSALAQLSADNTALREALASRRSKAV